MDLIRQSFCQGIPLLLGCKDRHTYTFPLFPPSSIVIGFTPSSEPNLVGGFLFGKDFLQIFRMYYLDCAKGGDSFWTKTLLKVGGTVKKN